MPNEWLKWLERGCWSQSYCSSLPCIPGIFVCSWSCNLVYAGRFPQNASCTDLSKFGGFSLNSFSVVVNGKVCFWSVMGWYLENMQGEFVFYKANLLNRYQMQGKWIYFIKPSVVSDKCKMHLFQNQRWIVDHEHFNRKKCTFVINTRSITNVFLVMCSNCCMYCCLYGKVLCWEIYNKICVIILCDLGSGGCGWLWKQILAAHARYL